MSTLKIKTIDSNKLIVGNCQYCGKITCLKKYKFGNIFACGDCYSVNNLGIGTIVYKFDISPTF